MKDKGPSVLRPTLLLIVPMLVLWLARPLALLFPEGRLWGINHLQFLSPAHTYAYIAVGIVALLFCLPPLRNIGERLFEKIAVFFADPAVLRHLILALVCLPVFWFLRMPTNLLGDGYSVINNIGNDLPVIFKWSETGAVYVIDLVARLVPFEGLARGEYAYAIVSVVSGAVTVFVFCGLAWELGRDAVGRLFIFCLLIFSGWMLLFLGYAENYPLLWPFVCGYIYVSIRYISGRGNLIAPVILLAAAILLHLQALFLTLSLPVLLTARGTGKALYSKHKTAIKIVSAILIAAGAGAVGYHYLHSMPFQIHFVPLLASRPMTPGYTLFSPAHLGDIINEISLLIPLWPLLLIFAPAGLRRKAFDAVDGFLLAASLGGLLFLSLIDPRLGMGRDWDLYALTCLPPMLWLGRMFIASNNRVCMFMVVIMTLIVTLPYFAVNLSRSPSLDYYQWLLHTDEGRSKPGFVVLRDYYYNTGDSTRGETINRYIWDRFPATRQAPLADRLSKQGRHAEALALADSVFAADPYSIESYNIRGMVNLRAGNFREAIANLEVSAAMGRYDSRTLVNLAQAYYRNGDRERMLANLYRALKLNPEGVNVLQAFAMGYLSLGEYDSSLTYAKELMRIDDTVPNGYLAAGIACFNTGRRHEARTYLTRFLEVAPPGPDRERAENTLQLLGPADSQTDSTHTRP